MASESAGRKGFFSLPFELRTAIYEEIIFPEQAGWAQTRLYKLVEPHSAPSLYSPHAFIAVQPKSHLQFTCKQCLEEIRQVISKTTHLHAKLAFHSGKTLPRVVRLDWLSFIPFTDNLKSITLDLHLEDDLTDNISFFDGFTSSRFSHDFNVLFKLLHLLMWDGPRGKAEHSASDTRPGRGMFKLSLIQIHLRPGLADSASHQSLLHFFDALCERMDIANDYKYFRNIAERFEIYWHGSEPRMKHLDPRESAAMVPAQTQREQCQRFWPVAAEKVHDSVRSRYQLSRLLDVPAR